jgi:hypothetical protein
MGHVTSTKSFISRRTSLFSFEILRLALSGRKHGLEPCLGSIPLVQVAAVWDFSGLQVASGIYFYEFRAGDFRDVRKMIRLR